MSVSAKNKRLARPTVTNPAIETIAEFSALSNPALPVGGTTGLCLQSSAVIDIAAAWYRANLATCEHPIIPALRRRFGLTPVQAIAVLREARH